MGRTIEPFDSGAAGLEPLEWAVAERTIPGEIESGDAALVTPFRGGILIAVVDGLGHGAEAAAAARAAVAALFAHASSPVAELIHLCHEALRGTRGVALAVVSLHLSTGELTWASVGNVDALVARRTRSRHERVLMRGGVVGHHLSGVRPSTVRIGPGDLILLATDGVSSEFGDDVTAGVPRTVADQILARFGRSNDDALVLAARLRERA